MNAEIGADRRILFQVTEYDPGVLESVIELVVEIARDGRRAARYLRSRMRRQSS